MTKSVRGLAAVLGLTVVGIVLCTAFFAWHEGYRVYVVRTGSMTPTFQPGDAILDGPTREGYVIGDPITVEVAPGTLVTHRLRTVDSEGKLLTKGDANETPDVWRLNPRQVRGVVQQVLPNLGYVLVFLRQPQGVLGVMTSAISLFLLWGLCFPATSPTVGAGDVVGTAVRVPRQRTAGDPAGIRPRTWSVRRSRDTADEDAPTRAQPK